MSRAVVVVDRDGVVTYTEQVPEIGQEPNYDAALAASDGIEFRSLRRDPSAELGCPERGASPGRR